MPTFDSLFKRGPRPVPVRMSVKDVQRSGPPRPTPNKLILPGPRSPVRSGKPCPHCGAGLASGALLNCPKCGNILLDDDLPVEVEVPDDGTQKVWDLATAKDMAAFAKKLPKLQTPGSVIVPIRCGLSVLVDQADETLVKSNKWSYSPHGRVKRQFQRDSKKHTVWLDRELGYTEAIFHINGNLLDFRRSNLKLKKGDPWWEKHKRHRFTPGWESAK